MLTGTLVCELHQQFTGSIVRSGGQLTELASTGFESGESKPTTARIYSETALLRPWGADRRGYSDHFVILFLNDHYTGAVNTSWVQTEGHPVSFGSNTEP
jgi:hypothetical protein